MQIIIQEIYVVEGESVESALVTAKTGATRDSVFLAADSLRGCFNPFHLAEAQNKFGTIAPPVVETTEATEPVEASVVDEPEATDEVTATDL